MKFSLNHIKRINQHNQTTGDITAIGIDALVEKIGTQLGAIDEIIDVGSKYQGALIVRVVSCEKHPNADKLSVCTIDDGKVVKDVERDKTGLVQVVCGAPNVHDGMLAVWLPPGVVVPETVQKDPFALEKREIRGVISNGMLASFKELALGEDHSGIVEIPGDFKPGSDFAEVMGLKDDIVLDIENKMFTHRPDCFGWLGVDRELAGIQGMSFKSPDWYVTQPAFPEANGTQLPLKIVNELPELVSRFSAIVLRDVQVRPSDIWVKTELAKHGVKSINNIVDFTNFFMLLTGQPLHAYDYDKVKALSSGEPTIVVRNPKPGEKIKLLNGKEIEPRPEAIMIATDRQLIGVGGVMGGSETEVDDNTTNVIIECANFDMYSIRRTSMAHGLFSDAVTRFTKGQSPLQTLAVLGRIVLEIVEVAKIGQIAGPVLDDNHLDAEVLKRGSLHVPVTLTTNFINDRLGLQLSAGDIQKLVENVEFRVEAKGDDLTVSAPFWRTDIELREDVVEEVGRLYGYDHLPLELPKRDLTPAVKDLVLDAKAVIRQRLSRAGANEVLTYSFVHGDLLDRVGQDKSKAFEVANALSPDLQYYRLSLTPSLLEKVHPNIKAGYDQFALFEIGQIHSPLETEDEVPKTFGRVALVYAASSKQIKTAPYYSAKKFATYLLGEQELRFVPLGEIDTSKYQLFEQMLRPFEPNRAALIFRGKQLLGAVGEYKPGVSRSLKLPRDCAGFELFLSAFTDGVLPGYTVLSRFPKVSQDITLKVSAELPYQELESCVLEALGQVQPDSSTWSLTPIDIFQAEQDQAHKNITYRLSISSYDRTLTDKEVNKLLDEVAGTTKAKLGAERI
jgi:phenylalanyl-tRNA synthetase beta chain